MARKGEPRSGYRPWTDDDLAWLRRRLADVPTPSYAVLAAECGRGYQAIAMKAKNLGIGVFQRARQGGRILPPDGAASGAPADPEAAILSNQPLSVEQVAEMWGLSLEEWEAVSVTPNTWAIGAKHPTTGEILTAPLYQTKVRFQRKPEATAKQLAAALLADIQADTQARARVRQKPRVIGPGDEPHALEVDEFDVHLNKLAWAAETGQDFDTNIAEDRARAAMTDLLAMAAPFAIERVILPIGNDLANIDNLVKTTTAGTPQDSDTRYHRMFRRARALLSWMIEQCAQIAPVEVVVVPGNHDELTAWTLGQVLEAEYARDARVTFQSGPKLRKYVEYGANLIGFTHGVDEPHAQLPQIMAVEQKDAWARTTHREWHLGHLHKQKATAPVMIDDKIGVTVRIIRALSGTDAWHARRGYIGVPQGAEAFLWRRSGGLRAHLYHAAARPA